MSLIFLIPIIGVAAVVFLAGGCLVWLAHNPFSPLGRGGLPR
jgi:hypothetical protein